MIENDEIDIEQLDNSYMKRINKLIGKKILFLDLETTGFPKRGDKSMPGGYADYKDNNMYDDSRILQFGWYYCDNFTKEFDYNDDDIKSIIRKPLNFNKIPKVAIDIHHITYERAIEEGVLIKKIFNGEFGEAFMKSDYVVGYNAYFDFSILANEIARLNYEDMYNNVLELKNNNVICMMSLCKNYMGKKFSQGNLYRCLYKKDPTDQHDAKGDVRTMLEIMKYVLNNPPPKDDIKPSKSKMGKKWNDYEDEQLKTQYLDENKNIDSIAAIHNRTSGGIRARLKKLNILKDEDSYHKNNDEILDRIKNLEDEIKVLKLTCKKLEKLIK